MGEFVITFLVVFVVFITGHIVGRDAVAIKGSMISVAEEKCKTNNGIKTIKVDSYSCNNGAEFQFKNG